MRGILHNESQDGKTELDSTFFHFKHQLRKYIRHGKSSVLTPSDMSDAMKYNNGLRNSHFNIVELNRNYLDKLFDDKGTYYGKLKQRITQVLPSNIAEVGVDNEGVCNIYESSALDPFEFNNKTVKKVDKYMLENRDSFKMGYSFFKKLTEDMNAKHDLVIPELPEKEENSLMTKTTILDTVVYENKSITEKTLQHLDRERRRIFDIIT